MARRARDRGLSVRREDAVVPIGRRAYCGRVTPGAATAPGRGDRCQQGPQARPRRDRHRAVPRGRAASRPPRHPAQADARRDGTGPGVETAPQRPALNHEQAGDARRVEAKGGAVAGTRRGQLEFSRMERESVESFSGLAAKGYQIEFHSHSRAILSVDFPEALLELENALGSLTIPIEEIIAGGGGEAKGTQRLRRALTALKWVKTTFEVKKTINGREREAVSHEIDHVREFPSGTV